MFILFIFISFITSIKIDKSWITQNIGTSDFINYNNQDDIIYIGSRSGLVSTIKESNGEIIHRQFMPEESLDDMRINGNDIITISNKVIRVWANTDKEIIWESSIKSKGYKDVISERLKKKNNLKESMEINSIKLNVLNGEDMILYINGKFIYYKDVNESENIKWEWDVYKNFDTMTAHTNLQYLIQKETHKIFLTFFNSSNKQINITIVELLYNREKVLSLKKHEIKRQYSNKSTAKLTTNGVLIIKNHKNQYSEAFDILNGQSISINIPFKEVNIVENSDSEHSNNIFNDEASYIISNINMNNINIIYEIKREHDGVKFRKLEFINGDVFRNCGRFILSGKISDKIKLIINKFEIESQKNIESEIVMDSYRGRIQKIVCTKSMNKFFILFEDQSLLFIKNHKIIWNKEGSLSYINDIIFHSNKSLIEKEKLTKKSLFSSIITTPLNIKTPLIDKNKVEKTDDAQINIIITSTNYGKIFGINSMNGNIEWELFLGNYGKIKTMNELSKHHILIELDNEKERNLIIVNKSNGDINKKINIKQKILQLFIINSKMMIFYENLNGEIINYLNKDKIDFKKKIFFYNINSKENIVNGYVVKYNNEKIYAKNIWRIALSNNEIISDVVKSKNHKEIKEKMRWKINGKNKIPLHKYLDDNMLIITTVNKEKQDSTINFYIIKIINGQIIFKRTHNKATGPVPILQYENRFIYHFKNINYTDNKNYYDEIISVELYKDNNLNYNEIQFKEQAYSFDRPIRFMETITSSRKILPKYILFALEDSSLIIINPNILDPHRYISDKDYTVIGSSKYYPVIYSSNFRNILSKKYNLEYVSIIKTTGTHVESILAFVSIGFDLFYCSFTPVKSFDRLDSSFNYKLLILSLVILLLSIFLVRRRIKKNIIKYKWK